MTSAAPRAVTSAIARQSPPDLILLSLGLPSEDVFALSEELGRSKTLARVPVFVLGCAELHADARERLSARLDRLVLSNTSAYLGPAPQWDERIAATLQAPDMKETAEGFLRNWFPPAMLRDDRIAHREAEPRPPPGRLGGVERLEDLRDLVPGNPHAIVDHLGDRRLGVAGPAPGADRDGALVVHRVGGVDEQRHHHLDELLQVRRHRLHLRVEDRPDG